MSIGAGLGRSSGMYQTSVAPFVSSTSEGIRATQLPGGGLYMTISFRPLYITVRPSRAVRDRLYVVGYVWGAFSNHANILFAMVFTSFPFTFPDTIVTVHSAVRARCAKPATSAATTVSTTARTFCGLQTARIRHDAFTRHSIINGASVSAARGVFKTNATAAHTLSKISTPNKIISTRVRKSCILSMYPMRSTTTPNSFIPKRAAYLNRAGASSPVTPACINTGNSSVAITYSSKDRTAADLTNNFTQSSGTLPKHRTYPLPHNKICH